MKTHTKDISLDTMSKMNNLEDLHELIDLRQNAKLENNPRFVEINENINRLIEEIGNINKKVANSLSDEIINLQQICFTKGYHSGIEDLGAALTFNKLGITSVEYVDL